MPSLPPKEEVQVLADVVIDTNVLKHADDPRQQQQQECIDLIVQMLEAKTVLAVDGGFSLDDTNSSLVGREYIDNLIPGMLGLTLLTELVNQERVKTLDLRPGAAVRKAINQRIRNKRDRTFVLLARETDEKVLVSHDFTDFDSRKRRGIKKDFQVSMVEACECCSLLV